MMLKSDQRMKQRLFFTCLGIILSCCLFSCTKYRLDRKEEKLAGTWVFDEVLKGPWTGRQSVIHRWKMYAVTFYENGHITWHNNETEEDLTGNWTLSEVNDSGNMVTLLNIAIRDTADNQYMYTWEIHRLTREKLRVYEPAAKPRDQMYYHMRKR